MEFHTFSCHQIFMSATRINMIHAQETATFYYEYINLYQTVDLSAYIPTLELFECVFWCTRL